MVKILVVPTRVAYNGLRNFSEFDDIINASSFYYDRATAETSEDILQIIPYIIIHTTKRIFTYKRLPKSNETRLHAKKSIGIGGHIDQPNITCSPYMAMYEGAMREVFEELSFPTQLEKEIQDNASVLFTNNYIFDNTNKVGRVHLGLIGKLQVDDNIADTITVKETEKIEGHFVPISELFSEYQNNSDVFENWTSIALHKLYYGAITL